MIFFQVLLRNLQWFFWLLVDIGLQLIHSSSILQQDSYTKISPWLPTESVRVYPLEPIRKYLRTERRTTLEGFKLKFWCLIGSRVRCFFYGHGSCTVYNQENVYQRAAIERSLLGWREKKSRESRFYFGHLSRKCWSLVLTRTEK
jgi:hypothetical protein